MRTVSTLILNETVLILRNRVLLTMVEESSVKSTIFVSSGPAARLISLRLVKVTEYEVTYTDVVPKDKQAVTTRKVEVDRHHEVRYNTFPLPPPAPEELRGVCVCTTVVRMGPNQCQTGGRYRMEFDSRTGLLFFVSHFRFW